MAGPEIAATRAPATMPFRRTYPGHPAQVGRVRHDLAAFLDGCPMMDELLLITSELCANAVTHSFSREPGGQFTVTVEVRPMDSVRVEVHDQGGVWDEREYDDDRPHGLDIVRLVAGEGNWGIHGDASPGRVVWAQLGWPAEDRKSGSEDEQPSLQSQLSAVRAAFPDFHIRLTVAGERQAFEAVRAAGTGHLYAVITSDSRELWVILKSG